MKTTKIILISLGALILESGVSFDTVAASGEDKVRQKRENTVARSSAKASSVLDSLSKIKEPYVHVDMESNAISGTNAPKIVEMIRHLSPKDQKNVKVSVEISPETSSKDRAVIRKYGAISDNNTIKMSGKAFGDLAKEELSPKILAFIEAQEGKNWKLFSGESLGPVEIHHYYPKLWMTGRYVAGQDENGEVVYDAKSGKKLAFHEFKSRCVTIVDKKFAEMVLKRSSPEEKVDVTVKTPAESSKVEELKNLGFEDTGGGHLSASQIKANEALLLISSLNFQDFISMIQAGYPK